MKNSKQMLTSIFLVRSEHLNHAGHLFGGDLMAEIDTLGYCLARAEFKSRTFVTRAATIAFEKPAALGDVITFSAFILRNGVTSVTVEVTGAVCGNRICRAEMIYVNIDESGGKKPL